MPLYCQMNLEINKKEGQVLFNYINPKTLNYIKFTLKYFNFQEDKRF